MDTILSMILLCVNTVASRRVIFRAYVVACKLNGNWLCDDMNNIHTEREI